MSSLSPYHVLVVIGTAMKSENNEIYGSQFITKNNGCKNHSGHAYGLIKKMVALGLLETVGECREHVAKKRQGAQTYRRVKYRLTDKGRRFGDTYNARAIAENPPLVALEDFV